MIFIGKKFSDNYGFDIDDVYLDMIRMDRYSLYDDMMTIMTMFS
jgi:hypothetical protein